MKFQSNGMFRPGTPRVIAGVEERRQVFSFAAYAYGGRVKQTDQGLARWTEIYKLVVCQV